MVCHYQTVLRARPSPSEIWECRKRGSKGVHHCGLHTAGPRDQPLSPEAWPLDKGCWMKFEEQQTGRWNWWVPVPGFLSPWHGFTEDSFPLKIWFPQSLKEKMRVEMTLDLHNCIIEIVKEMLYTFYRIIYSAVLLYKGQNTFDNIGF